MLDKPRSRAIHGIGLAGIQAKVLASFRRETDPVVMHPRNQLILRNVYTNKSAGCECGYNRIVMHSGVMLVLGEPLLSGATGPTYLYDTILEQYDIQTSL